MKKIILITLIFISLLFWSCGVSIQTMDNYGPEQTFSMLDQYGDWIFVPQLGHVWRPNVPPDWQPYTYGQWEWTNDGWMWISDEQFGWIVYHYGYWDFDDQYGWIWVPSYDWAPARVDWTYTNGYVGWAPIPPPFVSDRNAYYNQNYRKVWVVVPERNFVGNDITKYRTRSNENIQALRNQTGGRAPDLRDIERATNHKVETYNYSSDKVHSGNRDLIRVRNNGGRQEGQNQNNETRIPAQPLTPPTFTPPARTIEQPRNNPPEQNAEPPKIIPPVKGIEPPSRKNEPQGKNDKGTVEKPQQRKSSSTHKNILRNSGSRGASLKTTQPKNKPPQNQKGKDVKNNNGRDTTSEHDRRQR